MDVILLNFNESMTESAMECGNPTKKIRLDYSSTTTKNFNDELWGEDDITADDFDIATQPYQSHIIQSQIPATRSAHFVDVYNRNLPSTSTISIQDKDSQKQYEMEGKVKILSDSLDKLSKDLKEEKANREKIISEKIYQYEEREKQLNTKIKKMESVLQFKEQEMKSAYAKIHGQGGVNHNKSHLTEAISKKSPCKFIKKLDFGNETHSSHQCLKNTSPVSENCRKYKLLHHNPLGQTQPIDIISLVLCNQLSSTSNKIIEIPSRLYNAFNNFSNLSSMSIIERNSEQQVSDLLDHCYHHLENYISNLRAHFLKSEENLVLHHHKKIEEASNNSFSVISTLKDVIFLVSCPQFISVVRKWEQENFDTNTVIEIQDSSGSSSSSSTETVRKIHPLLQVLIRLADPNSYPNNCSSYEHIRYALTAIASWSFSAVEYLRKIVSIFPVSSLLQSSKDPVHLFICLKLMTNLNIYKEFAVVLVHKSDCLICEIAGILCKKIPKSSDLEYVNVMLMIEDFLSSTFSVHTSTDLQLESFPCSTKIIQGLVISLWWYFNKKTYHSAIIQILHKGLSLLHFLSIYIRNFKERRSQVEDVYISFVCGMLTLTKEDSSIEYDLISELWDFQEDSSELDVDEKSDDYCMLNPT